MNTALFMAAQAANQGSALPMILMMVAIFVIMWLFMIRPQQKRQKEIRAFQNSLKEGDSVVTGGGIYGTVKRIDLTANKIDIEISRGVVITVDKGYVFANAQASQMQNQGK
ncbi:MAG: preprotein translocase subunit YajC [Prevotella sp.]|nr:preprotein translocase subunit YajC [Prevotella sp.]